MLIARPIASDFRSTPGPEVDVTPSEPENAPPMATPAAAISSSAWRVRTPKFLCFDSSWRMSDAGVIGYDAHSTGSFAFSAAAMIP